MLYILLLLAIFQTNANAADGVPAGYTGHGYFRRGDADNFYFGQWENGQRHGRGITVYDNGTFYLGDFSRGRFHGQGSFYTDGSFVDGEWLNGRLAKGLSVAYDGGVSFCDFSEVGKKPTTIARSYYDLGSFSMVVQDKNFMISHDSTFHVMHRTNAIANGFGIKRLKDGRYFIGTWCADNFEDGVVIYTYKDDNQTITEIIIHVGTWRNGLPHGWGTEISSTGGVLREGLWNDGVFTDQVDSQESELRHEGARY